MKGHGIRLAGIARGGNCGTQDPVWRLVRRTSEGIVESREDFLAYAQTSPESYAWLPYQGDAPTPPSEGIPPD
jgi:hypothetical protein